MTEGRLIKAIAAQATARARQNQRLALLRPFRRWLDRRQLRAWSERLRQETRDQRLLIHIAWGFDSARGAMRDMTLAECLAIVSARVHHPSAVIVLHTPLRPAGPCWSFLERRVILTPFPPIQLFRRARWPNGVHEATMVRLLALNLVGGLSPAGDALLLRTCEDLMDGRFVTATQMMTTAGTGGLALSLLAAPRGHAVTRTLVATAGAFRPDEEPTTTLLNALYALYALEPKAVRVLPPQECALPARHAADNVLFGSPRWGGAPFPPIYARMLPLWSDVTNARLNAFGAAELAASQGLFATQAREVVARLADSDASDWERMIRALTK